MTPNQFFYRVHQLRRSLPHGQRPTDAHVKLALLLSRWQHNSPSHKQLAKAADVCVRTVGNALRRFRQLGVLNWEARFIRLQAGWMARTVNRYLFPEQSSLPASKPLRRADKSIKKGIFSSPAKFADEGKPPFSLAEIAAKRLAAVNTAWAERRGLKDHHQHDQKAPATGAA